MSSDRRRTRSAMKNKFKVRYIDRVSHINNSNYETRYYTFTRSTFDDLRSLTLKSTEYSGRFKETPCTIYGLPIDIYGRGIPSRFCDVCLKIETRDRGTTHSAVGNPDMFSYHTHPWNSYKIANSDAMSSIAPPSYSDLLYIIYSRYKQFEIVATLEGIYIVSTHIQFHMLLVQVLFKYYNETIPMKCLENIYNKIHGFNTIIQANLSRSPSAILKLYKSHLMLSTADTHGIMDTVTPMFDITFFSWLNLKSIDYVILKLTRLVL